MKRLDVVKISSIFKGKKENLAPVVVPSGYFVRKDVMYVQRVGIQSAVSNEMFVR